MIRQICQTFSLPSIPAIKVLMKMLRTYIAMYIKIVIKFRKSAQNLCNNSYISCSCQTESHMQDSFCYYVHIRIYIDVAIKYTRIQRENSI